ncbi:MAG: hypothetical protein AAF090_18205 [Bacteroidota bacterium]
MKSFKWLLFFACFPVSLPAQELHEDYLTVNLLKPIDPFFPRINAGYVFDMKNGYGIGANVGFGHETWSPFNTEEEPKINFRLREFRLEFIKFTERSKNLTEYLALEAFYLEHTETRINESYTPNSETRLEFDSANFERIKFGINAKAGIFFSLLSQFGVNCYGGLGLRLRKNTYSDVINPREDDRFDEEFLSILGDPIVRTYEREGTVVGLNLTVGVNIFLKLRKPQTGLSD